MKKILAGLIGLLLIPTLSIAASSPLYWNAPTTNTDSSPLTNLNGYVIAYGQYTSPAKNAQTTVGNVNSTTITGLSDATTYNFRIKAQTSDNQSSAWSNNLSYTTPTVIIVPPPTTTGTWYNTTTSTSYSKDGTAKYLEYGKIIVGMTGKIYSVRFNVKSYGKPTSVIIGLYNSSQKRLATTTVTANTSGYITANLSTPVSVTANQTIYIAVQAASGNLNKFACGATSGGYESYNNFSSGMPATLPTSKWSGNCLPTAGVLVK